MFTKKLNPTRWLAILVGSTFILGCASQGGLQASNARSGCHSSQMLSCKVRGHGSSKTYENCRCVYRGDLNTTLTEF